MENSFKVAANSLALLYKESVIQSKQSYQAGYEQGLQDVWEFISLRNTTGDGQIHVSELVEYLKLKHSQSQNESAGKRDGHANSLGQVGSSSATGNQNMSGIPRDADLKRRWSIEDMGLDVAFIEKRTKTEKMDD